MDTSHEARAQREAELWLEQCYDAVDSEDVPEGAELFCGCTTCIVREVLTAATPHLYAALIELLAEEGIDVPTRVEKLLTSS